MKLRKWLKYIDAASVKCNIWIGDDCVYAGSMYDIPYWLTQITNLMIQINMICLYVGVIRSDQILMMKAGLQVLMGSQSY